ncbi:hypothetical protein MBLNU457_4332t1 [Dothideomycetes sp. NU457]
MLLTSESDQRPSSETIYGTKWLCPNLDPNTAQNELHQAEPKVEPKIDPKSLTQQLCNTAAIRNFSSDISPIQPFNNEPQSLKSEKDPYQKAFRLANTVTSSELSWHNVFQTLLLPTPPWNRGLWDMLVLHRMHVQPMPRKNIEQHVTITLHRTYQDIMHWYEHEATVAACHRVLVLMNGRHESRTERDHKVEKGDFSWATTKGLRSDDMIKFLKGHKAIGENINPSCQTYAAMWLLWLQFAFLRNWNGGARIRANSVAGVALRLMRLLCNVFLVPNPFIANIFTAHSSTELELSDVLLAIPRISFHLTSEALIADYLTYLSSPEVCHLVDFEFLFKTIEITEHFRTYCHMKMRKAFGTVEACNLSRNRFSRQFGLAHDAYLDRRLKIDLQYYLVIKVSRESVLADAFDQLWQRERRELYRPLRVRMGMEEGEIGHDLGGVQVEFFNLVCKEAFESDRSLFVIDPETQLAWLRPFSLEPLYRYELLGLLFGLAMYNGITLPVSLPLAFYRKLLGNRCNFDDLKEGWPSLARNLESLLSMDGVEDLAVDFTYTVTANGLLLDAELADPWYSGTPDEPGLLTVYSFSSDGSRADLGEDDPAYHMVQTVRADEEGMELDLKWPGWTVKQLDPGDPNHEPISVTSRNRHEYVDNYTQWILDWSVRPQFYAFAAGFYRAVDTKATRMLTPEIFRSLLEGQNHLDINELRAVTTYDGYTKDSKQIKWFWQVVESYSQEKQKLLLEFVTASKRVPIHGASTLVFRIEDMEADTGSLPGSSTCFGTLRLPRYESMEKLRTKLDIALEHSIGFGQA